MFKTNGTRCVHLSPAPRPLQFSINKDIVEVISGNLLFHPDNVEGVLQSRALAHFKLVVVEEDDPYPYQRLVDNYVALIKRHDNLIYVFAT